MTYWLSGYGKSSCTLVVLILLLFSPSLQAEGLRSPEAVAQAFVTAYRSGDAAAIVALQIFADDSSSFAVANRRREQDAWLRRMSTLRMQSYRVANMLARDHAGLMDTPLRPQKKLIVQYAGRSGRVEETYYIGQLGGSYYLLTVHNGQ